MNWRGTWGVGLIVWTALTGCQHPRVLGSGALSASDSGSGNSSASGNSSQSDSGSGNSGASGDSSRSDSGSGDSSQSDSGNSGQSDSGSGDSSQSDSGSGDSSRSDSGSGDSSRSDSGSGDSSRSDSGSGDSTAESSRPTEVSGSSKGSESKSSPISSITLVGVTVGGLGVVIWRTFSAAAQAIPPPVALGEVAQAYLRARNHQLREDLALGAGPSIEDLASLARIRRENLRLFGQVLRAHRGELLALAQPAHLTPARALEWLERVGRLAGEEPRLQRDASAFLAAQGLGE